MGRLSAVEVAKRARKLIENRKNWIQKTYSVDKDGISCPPEGKDAARFCALGALRHIDRGLGDMSPAALGVKELCKQKYQKDLHEVNDSRGGHKKILALFDQFIETHSRKKAKK